MGSGDLDTSKAQFPEYWNFQEKFKLIDRVTEELNPIINNQSIQKYIKKSFHYIEEEEADTKIRSILRENMNLKEKIAKSILLERDRGPPRKKTLKISEPAPLELAKIIPNAIQYSVRESPIYNKQNLYESIKKVRYSQLFSGFQNIKGKVEGYEEL